MVELDDFHGPSLLKTLQFLLLSQGIENIWKNCVPPVTCSFLISPVNHILLLSAEPCPVPIHFSDDNEFGYYIYNEHVCAYIYNCMPQASGWLDLAIVYLNIFATSTHVILVFTHLSHQSTFCLSWAGYKSSHNFEPK